VSFWGAGAPLREKFDRLDLSGLSFDERYRLLNGSVIPRPIAFVSTLNEDGTLNAAPFSSFMIASVEAGYLAFSVGPSDRPKGTLENIERNKEFVINTVPEELAHQVQICGEVQESGISKMERAGLHVTPSEKVATPRIAESKVHFECRLHTILSFSKSRMVVGEILLMHALEGVVRNGKIDPLHYGPLGRIAGRNYCSIRNIISV
jgi:flavin reductase (DIM6/NTAB) family NADH-FMN oxidoreductase RutF